MEAILLSSLVSLALLLAAAFFALSEFRTRRDPGVDEAFHTPHRFRRRIGGTLLLALIAVMFFWGVNRLEAAPLPFLLFWGAWLLLLFLLTLLAFYDMEETKAYFAAKRKAILSELMAGLSTPSGERKERPGMEAADGSG